MHYGVSIFPQYTSWNAMRDMALAVESWGYDSLWTWDHFLPIFGDAAGPNFEGWQILPAWAALTNRIKLGMLVSGNTYRHPTVLSKMAATLDHISNGRAILGMGAAWFDMEHTQYGLDFGKSAGDRLNRLGEALPIVRSMLDNETTTFEGKYYQVRDAYAEPKPVQKHLPIMIGGGGEQKTLRLVARYGDYWNCFGGPQDLAHKLKILQGHCAEAGTDFNRIESSVMLFNVVIATSQADVDKRLKDIMTANGVGDPHPALAPIAGPPEFIARVIHEYHKVGVKGVIIGGATPYDRETLERIQTEVKPLVEQMGASVRV